MLIGVTGLIGSGKSEVAAVFKSQGAICIDADAIGREVLETDAVVFYRLLLEFGTGVLHPNLTLNRRELGRLAFASGSATARLNAIVHPPLLRRLDDRIAEARLSGRDAVVDAALLIFWNYQTKMDFTIVVSSFKRNRVQRLSSQGFSPQEIRQRMRSQQSMVHLRRQADITIANNKDLFGLHDRIRRLYRQLSEKG